MATIKMPISNVKLLFYPPCEVKCGLQNRVVTGFGLNGFELVAACCLGFGSFGF